MLPCSEADETTCQLVLATEIRCSCAGLHACISDEKAHTQTTRTEPKCDLRLWSGPCQAGGQVYTKAVQTDNLLLQAVPSQGVSFSLLQQPEDLVRPCVAPPPVFSLVRACVCG